MTAYRDSAALAARLDFLERRAVSVRARANRLARRRRRPHLRWAVGALASMAIAALLVGVGHHMYTGRRTDMARRAARTQATGLRQAALAWMSENSECPTVPMLVQGKMVDGEAKLTDPWDRPFVVSCFDVVVQSAGPDGERETQDDALVATPANE